MRNSKLIWIMLAAASCSGGGQAQSPNARGGSAGNCAAAASAVPQSVCIETRHGAVLAGEQQEAQRIAALAMEGEARFERFFGRAPPRYVVVQGEASRPTLAALKAAGFMIQLPWFTRSAFQSGLEASVARQVETQLAGHGMTPEQIEEQKQKALAQIREKMSTAKFDRDPQAIPHELGHGWYVQSYWPGFPVDAQGHYGGPGPDWLDETAAILMETDSAAQERRAMFVKAYRGQDGLKLDDLATFLHRDHPMKNLNEKAFERAAKNGPGVIVMRSQEGGPEFENARQAGVFYAQGRVFADFMLAQTGRDTVFAEIGQAFGQGKTIEQWLAARGKALGLGSDLAGLDQRWRAWLVKTYGSAAAS